MLASVEALLRMKRAANRPQGSARSRRLEALLSNATVSLEGRKEVEALTTVRSHEGPFGGGAGCFIAATSYLRDGVILGSRARVGHAVELKSSILCRDSAFAHLSYVGNSLVGSGVNLEAALSLPIT